MTDQKILLEKYVEDYRTKEAYHGELMDLYFKDSNPMTDPQADSKFKKIGMKMKERFGDD